MERGCSTEARGVCVECLIPSRGGADEARGRQWSSGHWIYRRGALHTLYVAVIVTAVLAGHRATRDCKPRAGRPRSDRHAGRRGPVK